MHSDIQAVDDIMEGRVDPTEEPQDELPISRIGRMFKDRAVMVAETVSEVIRGKAQEVTEKFDQTIEREVQSHAGISLLLLLRDIAMGLAPLAILVLLQQYW